MMFRAFCLSVMVVSVMLLPATARAVGPALAAYDDFNDDSMNASMWRPFIDGIGPVANETNGWVEVTLPADSHEAESPHSFGGGFKSRQCLRGDFDMKIDYFLLDWPAGSGVRVGLELFPDTAGRLGNIQRAGFGKEVKTPSELYAVDYQTSSGAVPTAHMSGSLRMVRIGSRLTCGVLLEGEWVEVYSADFGGENYYVAFTAWSHDYAFNQQPVRVAFDNFALLYGQFVDPKSPPADALTSSVLPKTLPAATAAKGVVSRIPSLRSSLLVRMPRGRPFFRMETLPAKVLPSKCGPYKRLTFTMPPGRAGVKR